MIAAVPYHGGATWAVLQYVLGLRRLGHEVAFAEQVAPSALGGAPLAAWPNAGYAQAAAQRFGLDRDWALLEEGTTRTAGLRYEDLRARAASADVVINISGILTEEALMDSTALKVYLDLDPAFNQLWHAQGIDMHFSGHDRFVTVGQAIGTPQCPVPTSGIEWIPTVPPVVIDDWPVAGDGKH